MCRMNIYLDITLGSSDMRKAMDSKEAMALWLENYLLFTLFITFCILSFPVSWRDMDNAVYYINCFFSIWNKFPFLCSQIVAFV